MFSSLKALVAPKKIQELNLGIYQLVKLSLFFTIFSLPWSLVNLFIKFSFGTFPIFVLAFLSVVPNIMVIRKFYQSQDSSFKEYKHELQQNYWKHIKTALPFVFALSFYMIDCFIVIRLMKAQWLFPVLYTTLMFLVVAGIYSFILRKDNVLSWKRSIKMAMLASWRHFFTTFLIFMVLMLWFSLGYFLQGVNCIFGNAFFWGVIFMLSQKKLKKIFPTFMEGE